MQGGLNERVSQQLCLERTDHTSQQRIAASISGGARRQTVRPRNGIHTEFQLGFRPENFGEPALQPSASFEKVAAAAAPLQKRGSSEQFAIAQKDQTLRF